MNTGDRIKKLRKTLDLTQQKFGERIGIKGNTVSQYELGRSNPVDSVFSLICREFDVREEWLRTGEGEMFKQKNSNILDQLAYKYKLFNFDYIMIKKFLEMPPEIRRAIYEHYHDVDSALAEIDPYSPAYARTESPHSMDTKISITEPEQEPTTGELEVEYKKSCSNFAQKTKSSALSTTADTENENGNFASSQ